MEFPNVKSIWTNIYEVPQSIILKNIFFKLLNFFFLEYYDKKGLYKRIIYGFARTKTILDFWSQNSGLFKQTIGSFMKIIICIPRLLNIKSKSVLDTFIYNSVPETKITNLLIAQWNEIFTLKYRINYKIMYQINISKHYWVFVKFKI